MSNHNASLDIDVLNDLIESTTKRLNYQLEKHHTSSENLADAKYKYEDKEATLLRSGVKGSNEKERKANMKLELEELERDLRAKESFHKAEIRDLEIARLEHDAMRYKIRLLESSRRGS